MSAPVTGQDALYCDSCNHCYPHKDKPGLCGRCFVLEDTQKKEGKDSVNFQDLLVSCLISLALRVMSLKLYLIIEQRSLPRLWIYRQILSSDPGKRVALYFIFHQRYEDS